jgi:hypothetical protein
MRAARPVQCGSLQRGPGERFVIPEFAPVNIRKPETARPAVWCLDPTLSGSALGWDDSGVDDGRQALRTNWY